MFKCTFVVATVLNCVCVCVCVLRRGLGDERRQLRRILARDCARGALLLATLSVLSVVPTRCDMQVANRAAVREQQKKEIKRLTTTRQNLKEYDHSFQNAFGFGFGSHFPHLVAFVRHQDYLNSQLQQYENYLQDCRVSSAS